MVQNNELEELRRLNRSRFSHRADMLVDELNRNEQNLNNYFSTAAIFIFGFTSFVFNQAQDSNFPENARNLLVFSWWILFLSVICGAIHIFLNLNYLSRMKKIANDSEDKWASFSYPSAGEYKEMLAEVKGLNSDMPSYSTRGFLISQGVLVCLAFLTVVISTSILMLK